MYAYIKGVLAELHENYLVIENNGIGYQIFVPARSMDALPARGSTCKLYTHLHVREDAFLLFGFSSMDELGIFRLLINVSGIGPKGALGILSVLSADEVRFAVISDDVRTICKAPGIGQKTAKKLIIELKDKISIEDAFSEKSAAATAALPTATNAVKQEAMEALCALGYSAAEASKAVSNIAVAEDTTVEELLLLALKGL